MKSTRMNKWRDRRSFGPTLTHGDDGSFQASCTWCAFRVNVSCTHKKPARIIPDPEHTPEWCEMREGMLRDVAEVAAKS